MLFRSILLNVIDHGMNIAEATNAPRIHHQWLPDRTSFESYGFSLDTMKLYESFGHTIAVRGSQGSAMAIFIDYENELLFGSADSRSFDGGAVGF